MFDEYEIVKSIEYFSTSVRDRRSKVLTVRGTSIADSIDSFRRIVYRKFIGLRKRNVAVNFRLRYRIRALVGAR